ncbi:MAG: protein kinase [Candidatus Competibacteraceae bacterium]|nr:protein kinase [Candidatus Competibacteraceae bacterium]
MPKKPKTPTDVLPKQSEFQTTAVSSPDFLELLKNPLLSTQLPRDFDPEMESTHFLSLWKEIDALQAYQFDKFIFAGGSGAVFRVKRSDIGAPLAMKIARAKLFAEGDASNEVATTLSPLSDSEIRALKSLSHQNVVRLYDAISGPRGIFAVCTSYVEEPLNLDEFLLSTLAKVPHNKAKYDFLSPQRLELACAFLVKRYSEVASAVTHMHDCGIYHFDIKPANILVSSTQQAILTDMGACIHLSDFKQLERVRVHFTWTYAHPDLTDIVSDPAGVSGGGLKASAEIDVKQTDLFAKYDLYAFGKTIQETLGILEREFGERCHASYGFRFLHIIACLLLDGRNAPGSTKNVNKDGHYFVDDFALSYDKHIFYSHKIRTAKDLYDRLSRFEPTYSLGGLAIEFDSWQSDTINVVVNSPAPFTPRVSSVFNHLCMRRLKSEHQLGWMREIYPGATHDRWSHSAGVLSAVISAYNALLSDPEVPTFRVLVDKNDVSHAFVAAIIHDLGQTSFGHDLEEVFPNLYSHEELRERLLYEKSFQEGSLADVITSTWPEVNIQRVLRILSRRERLSSKLPSDYRAIDGVASDLIDGPIDSDKLDYLLRDGAACGVPYAKGMDPARFLRALTVTSVGSQSGSARLGLAYKAKGRPAVEALLIARYQMFGAVYWHHTYRCIQSMFVHAAVATFGELAKGGARKIRGVSLNEKKFKELLYRRVICGATWRDCQSEGLIPGDAEGKSKAGWGTVPPAEVSGERIIEFLWNFADDSTRQLLVDLARRRLYKRIFEMRVGELGDWANYEKLKSSLSPSKRRDKAKLLQSSILDAILNAMRTRGTTESLTETAAKGRLDTLRGSTKPLVVIDFPMRGVPNEHNMPHELGDPMRKYSIVRQSSRRQDDNVFHSMRRLQEHMSMIRVFVDPELHDLVIRYLEPEEIFKCVSEQIPELVHE